LLELLEDIDVSEGSEVVLTIDVVEKVSAGDGTSGAKPVDTYDLGTFLPLTRSEIYDAGPTPLEPGSYPLGFRFPLDRAALYDDDDE
jgi:hypothetical protein